MSLYLVILVEVHKNFKQIQNHFISTRTVKLQQESPFDFLEVFWKYITALCRVYLTIFMVCFSQFCSLAVCDDYITDTEWKNAREDSLKNPFWNTMRMSKSFQNIKKRLGILCNSRWLWNNFPDTIPTIYKSDGGYLSGMLPSAWQTMNSWIHVSQTARKRSVRLNPLCLTVDRGAGTEI